MAAMNGTAELTSFDHYRMDTKMLGWNTPEDYLAHVHPHWRSFEAINPVLHHLLGVLYIMIMFCGVIGNGVVIWIFSTTKHLRSPSNMLVVNLALLDFMNMMTLVLNIVHSFNEGPIWGKFGCDVYTLISAYNGIGAAITNAAIAYDRYRTIAHPIDGKLTRKQVMMLIAGIWLWATPFSVMPLLGIWGRFVPEAFLTTCSFDYMTEDPSTRLFVGCIFVYSYVIPFCLIVYFYSKIVSLVNQHEKALRRQARKMNVESLRTNRDQNETSAEIRIAKMAIGLALLFAAAWTPYGAIALIAAFGNRALLTPGFAMIPAFACKTVACIDPLIFAISHPRYRMEIQKRMPWFCVHEPIPQENESATTEKTISSAESK